MTGISPVDGHMDDGTYMMTRNRLHVKLPHQFLIAHRHGNTVHLGCDAVTADLLHVRHPALVQRLSIGLFQAAADGMG